MATNIYPVFYAIVKEGKILFSDKDMLKMHISTLEGKDIDVIVRQHRKDRTHSQNKWYWGCVVAISAKHYSYTSDEMHEAFKWLFLFRNEEGKPFTVRSTSNLSTMEFAEYAEKCRKWCAEKGLLIPDPDTLYLEKGQEKLPI